MPIENAEPGDYSMPPDVVDQQIRRAIQMCWMMLPGEKRTVSHLEAELRRIFERAVEDMKEDAKAFRFRD